MSRNSTKTVAKVHYAKEGNRTLCGRNLMPWNEKAIDASMVTCSVCRTKIENDHYVSIGLLTKNASGGYITVNSGVK